MTTERQKCANCGKQRRCLLVEVSKPCDDGIHEYEVQKRLTICRPCMRVVVPGLL